MLRHGVNTALAENLFKSEELSLGKAAALAHMSIAEFAEYLSQLGIAVVDYPIEELEEELRIHWRQDSEITRMHDP
jgi:predicted HTH domain antitoxin